jgi:acylphosphatase
MSPGDVARLEALVKGRVQGVGFRYFVMSEALRLGLTGWVANEQDGSVYCVAEGRREDLLLLLEALHEGPAAAIVDRVVETWLPGTGAFADFGLRSAGHRGD